MAPPSRLPFHVAGFSCEWGNGCVCTCPELPAPYPISIHELRAWDEVLIAWQNNQGEKPELPATADVWMYPGKPPQLALTDCFASSQVLELENMGGGRRSMCGHKEGSLAKFSRLFLGTQSDLVSSSFPVMIGRKTMQRRLQTLTIRRL